MLGLLGSAMQGGATAVNEIADNSIKAKRERAILDMRQRYQTSERIAGQEFTANQGEIDRSFRAGESEADRAQRLRLAEMREQGANSRSAQGGWTLTKDVNGNPVRFNTITGAKEPVEGLSVPEPELTSREKALKDVLLSERETLIETSIGQPDKQTADRLGEIDAQLESMLGSTGGNGLLGGVRRDLGIDGSNTPSSASPEQSEPEGSNATPPPRPNINSVDEIEAEVRAERKVEGDQRALKQQTSDIEDEVTQIQGLAAKMGQGPRVSAAERAQLGQQIRERGNRLLEQYDLDDRQIERLKTAIENAVQYGG